MLAAGNDARASASRSSPPSSSCRSSARSSSRSSPRSRPDFAKLLALLSSVGTAALTMWLLASFETGDAGYQFQSIHTWIEPWGISWHLGVDGISLFLVVLTGLLFPLAIVGVDPHHDERPYLAWLLMLQAGVMGSFLSLDLFVFFIFFEIVLVPMYFLIGGWGYENRVVRGHEVLPVHDVRLGVHARRPDRHRRPRQPRPGPHHVRPGRDRRRCELRRVDGPLAVLRLRHRVRRQGADLPVAHVAARRPHAGTDGRFDRAGRRDAQARHVRLPALRPRPVPRGGVLEPAVLADPGGDRHRLRRGRGHDADGPQTPRRLFVGRPHGLHHPRHVRRSPRSRCRAP